MILYIQKEKINNENIPCFIDQFCDVDLYYSYLQYEDKVITKNITFKTKGESQYPSVAVSSMIARYCFLKEIEILENKYQVKIILLKMLRSVSLSLFLYWFNVMVCLLRN